MASSLAPLVCKLCGAGPELGAKILDSGICLVCWLQTNLVDDNAKKAFLEIIASSLITGLDYKDWIGCGYNGPVYASPPHLYVDVDPEAGSVWHEFDSERKEWGEVPKPKFEGLVKANEWFAGSTDLNAQAQSQYETISRQKLAEDYVAAASLNKEFAAQHCTSTPCLAYDFHPTPLLHRNEIISRHEPIGDDSKDDIYHWSGDEPLKSLALFKMLAKEHGITCEDGPDKNHVLAYGPLVTPENIKKINRSDLINFTPPIPKINHNTYDVLPSYNFREIKQTVGRVNRCNLHTEMSEWSEKEIIENKLALLSQHMSLAVDTQHAFSSSNYNTDKFDWLFGDDRKNKPKMGKNARKRLARKTARQNHQVSIFDRDGKQIGGGHCYNIDREDVIQRLTLGDENFHRCPIERTGGEDWPGQQSNLPSRRFTFIDEPEQELEKVKGVPFAGEDHLLDATTQTYLDVCLSYLFKLRLEEAAASFDFFYRDPIGEFDLPSDRPYGAFPAPSPTEKDSRDHYGREMLERPVHPPRRFAIRDEEDELSFFKGGQMKIMTGGDTLWPEDTPTPEDVPFIEAEIRLRMMIAKAYDYILRLEKAAKSEN